MHKLRLESNDQKTSGARIKGPSGEIARIYKISPKAVRDIWNHVTWKYATNPLWVTTSPCESKKHVDVDPEVCLPIDSKVIFPNLRKSTVHLTGNFHPPSAGSS
jgi:hypothetical protein